MESGDPYFERDIWIQIGGKGQHLSIQHRLSDGTCACGNTLSLQYVGGNTTVGQLCVNLFPVQSVECKLNGIRCEISRLHATMRVATSKRLSTSAAIERRSDKESRREPK